MSPTKIHSRDFYGEYHGHPTDHLEILLPELRAANRNLIWLAGDSSLDNKYWFGRTASAVGVYKNILSPPTSKCDVTHYINEKCEQEGRDMAAINTAVEATTLNERAFKLRSQDVFLRDNIKGDDILVVSVGGNDVAMSPAPCTIASICGLLCLPVSCIESGVTCGTVPITDCCCGCGPSLASCACAFPPCLGYTRHLFGTRVEAYIKALTKRQRPKKILVCMIYYPDESPTPSWAGGALAALGYDSNPKKLQLLIRKAFVDATSRIKIPGSQVVPVPLFHVLDGKNSRDYIARVEPSPSGGSKMAEYILHMIDQSDVSVQQRQHQHQHPADTGYTRNSSPPSTSYISERS